MRPIFGPAIEENKGVATENLGFFGRAEGEKAL